MTAPWVARLLLAPLWLVGLALLVKGHHGAGDGFSAGLVVGAGVLLQQLVFGLEQVRRFPLVRHARTVAAVGLLTLLVPVFGPLLAGQPPLTHHALPGPGEGAWSLGTLSLHSGLVLDAGVFLVVLGFVLQAMDALAARDGP